jgi:hypothetical protein
MRHGHSHKNKDSNSIGSPTYSSWKEMRKRCLAPTSIKFKYYGALGITICERWNAFKNFLADMGERPAGTTLGRIGDVGNYEPGNVKWMTPTEQGAERRKKNLAKQLLAA